MTPDNITRRTSPDEVTQRQRQTPVMRLPGGKLAIAKPGVTLKTTARAVDLCFVFDTTGSMSGKIDGLVVCMSDLVTKLDRTRLDWRVTTLPFGDLTVAGDRVDSSQPFVSDLEMARQQLCCMPRFGGGANLGESSVEAMLAACNKPYRGPAVKVLVLITDEPALGNDQAIGSVHGALASLDAACFTVAPDLPYYKSWAQQHGGEWRLVASAVDTSAIERLFRSLLTRVVELADSVHRLGGGSVRAYLERGGD